MDVYHPVFDRLVEHVRSDIGTEHQEIICCLWAQHRGFECNVGWIALGLGWVGNEHQLSFPLGRFLTINVLIEIEIHDANAKNGLKLLDVFVGVRGAKLLGRIRVKPHLSELRVCPDLKTLPLQGAPGRECGFCSTVDRRFVHFQRVSGVIYLETHATGTVLDRMRTIEQEDDCAVDQPPRNTAVASSSADVGGKRVPRCSF